MSKIIRQSAAAFGIVSMVALLVAMLTGDLSSAETTVKFASAPPGGNWYTEAHAISEAVNRKIAGITISPTTGGAASTPIAVSTGKAEIGLTFANTLYEAYQGIGPYKQPYKGVRVLVALIPSYIQWIVPRSSKLFTVEDLKGKVTVAGPKGLVSEFIATELFKIYGIKRDQDVTIRNFGFQDCVEALKDGQADAITITPTIPYSLFIDASKMMEIRFIKFQEAKINEFVKNNPGFVKIVVPKEMLTKIYGEGVADENLVTAFTPQIICTSSDLDENAAYQITKGLAESLKEIGMSFNPLAGLDAKDLFVGDLGVPYHAGSVKYFKERGWTQ